MVGEVNDIDWFAPNGDKLLPNRQDISVSSNDDTSSTLTIYSATVDNAGIYKCVAKSGDKEAEATVNVKIYRKLYTLQDIPRVRNHHCSWILADVYIINFKADDACSWFKVS